MSSFGGFMKGVGAGIVVGAATATVVKSMSHGHKHIKKNAMKAMKTAGDFFSNVQYMFK